LRAELLIVFAVGGLMGFNCGAYFRRRRTIPSGQMEALAG
jgi:hypothetical protein